MALHRDIYWVGRQWAVTGYGVQACDQKQKGQFDIEGSRLWEEGAQDSLRAQKWLNVEDFEKALGVARKYFPEPSRDAQPPDNPALPTKDGVRASGVPQPMLQAHEMTDRGWGARFVPVWRIRAGLGVPDKSK